MAVNSPVAALFTPTPNSLELTHFVGAIEGDFTFSILPIVAKFEAPTTAKLNPNKAFADFSKSALNCWSCS